MMAAGRIAGDGRFYRWIWENADDGPGYRLIRHDGNPTDYFRFAPEPEDVDVDQLFDSMTTVIKAVMGASFSSAAWWGYKCGAAASVGISDLKDTRVLAKYDMLKKTGIHPNSVRDKAGARGNFAHDLCQAYWLGDVHFAESPSGVAAHGILPDGTVLDGHILHSYNLAASDWLESQAFVEVEEERVVWSERLRVQGTFDLLATHEDGTLELIDYKTHKPAADRGKPNLEYPAYIEDVLQLRGYRTCLEDMGEPVPDSQRVVLFLEDGTWAEDTRDLPPEAFEATVHLYRAMALLDQQKKGEA